VNLPNALPRPPGELERLQAVWAPPSGLRFITEVNNIYIGLFYIAAGILFFILAGILALLMRAQLAVPENTLVGHNLYNQLFTMHGTMMMFLFAVPVVEATGVFLLPNMQAARDLPFPRLGAYAFWAYLIGGLVFFSSLFFGLAPDGGWFMYPPLTSYQYSPSDNADFWLLGIGFIEISAIAGAIEIVVGVLRTRAPGMSLDNIPIYSWAMLVFAGMVIFAFPAVILATALLELERAFQWPFFLPEKGGNPLLWQHLFWFFGHPEVYIIFLPAAGMVSMMVPTIVQSPLVGYRLVVLALIATGFLSFSGSGCITCSPPACRSCR
jgi:cytochrome c oxidase subunit I+III